VTPRRPRAPRTASVALATLAALVALGACADPAAAPAGRPATTPATDAPAAPDAPATTSAHATTAPGAVEISVVVGEDAGPDRVERVALGTDVVLRVRNDGDDDEFHLHGYDLGGDVTPAGEEAVYRFTATQAGEFSLESHVTGDLLLTLVVDD
jgi:hypothetical protein